MAKPQAKKRTQAQPPKRKIGRYVLALLVLTPLVFKAASNIDGEVISNFVAKVQLPEILKGQNSNENEPVQKEAKFTNVLIEGCLLYTSPSPRDA